MNGKIFHHAVVDSKFHNEHFVSRRSDDSATMKNCPLFLRKKNTALHSIRTSAIYDNFINGNITAHAADY